MPPNPAPWLTEILMEIGPSEATGMGATVISWQALGEWQGQMDVRLEPWQLRLLRRLSLDYIIEGNRAEKKGCASPWAVMTLERRRQIVADKVDQILGALSAMPATPPRPAKRGRK